MINNEWFKEELSPAVRKAGLGRAAGCRSVHSINRKPAAALGQPHGPGPAQLKWAQRLTPGKSWSSCFVHFIVTSVQPLFSKSCPPNRFETASKSPILSTAQNSLPHPGYRGALMFSCCLLGAALSKTIIDTKFPILKSSLYAGIVVNTVYGPRLTIYGQWFFF
jgi:hypothetical protein